MKLKFNKTYALLTLLLFLTEVCIAVYLKSGFIRYTVGDFLVVILIYSFLKIFIEDKHFKIAVSVLAFAFIIEFLQLTNYLELFNLQDNYYANLILGSSFHISDLVAYTLGTITIIALEYKIYKLWMP